MICEFEQLSTCSVRFVCSESKRTCEGASIGSIALHSQHRCQDEKTASIHPHYFVLPHRGWSREKCNVYGDSLRASNPPIGFPYSAIVIKRYKLPSKTVPFHASSEGGKWRVLRSLRQLAMCQLEAVLQITNTALLAFYDVQRINPWWQNSSTLFRTSL